MNFFTEIVSILSCLRKCEVKKWKTISIPSWRNYIFFKNLTWNQVSVEAVPLTYMIIPSLIQTFANRIFHSTVQYVYVQIHGQNMYFPPQKQSPMRARESTSRGSWSTFSTQETTGTGTQKNQCRIVLYIHTVQYTVNHLRRGQTETTLVKKKKANGIWLNNL
jgi:hypothetical protein